MARDGLSGQVDAAIAEYLNAVKQGAPPERAAFLAQHPTISVELEEFLTDYRAFDSAVRIIADATSTSGGVNSTGRLESTLRQPLPAGQRFGNFELIEEIARGGMGVVYKARQKKPDRIVALKMILAGQLASQSDVDRFTAEAQAAAALDHPRIVPIFEFGEQDGQHYFTMGYVAGESLAQRLSHGTLPAREAATVIRDVALAVDYAHQQCVIHRDLKPANILVDPEGRVRVTDFGLAKRQTDESGLTCTGQLLGTPSFMSPEQVSGDRATIGPASDVYSLGATLYALVTGRPPFHAASTIDTLKQVVEREPVPPREFDVSIPRDLETITLKCLEKSPAARYVSARALAEDIEFFLADRPIVARRPRSACSDGVDGIPWWRRSPRRWQRHWSPAPRSVRGRPSAPPRPKGWRKIT
jgi:serine/threonine protein kinase